VCVLVCVCVCVCVCVRAWHCTLAAAKSANYVTSIKLSDDIQQFLRWC